MEINYIKLGMTIFIAITFSELIVNRIEIALVNKSFKEVNFNINKELEKSNRKYENSLKNIQMQKTIEFKKRKKENERIKSIRTTNDETCNFWSEEYSKVKSDYNKVMKNSACSRARND